MTKKLTIKFALTLFISTNYALATEDVFTGDTKLSCEAVLCLATGSPPNECSPALNRYYSIDYDDFDKTIKKRVEFLNICPVSGETPQMQSLVNAMAKGAGRCDATSLNVTLREWVSSVGSGVDGGYFCISSELPDYCKAYMSHEYTDIENSVKYVIDSPKQQYNPFTPNDIFSRNNNNFSNRFRRACGHWVNQ